MSKRPWWAVAVVLALALRAGAAMAAAPLKFTVAKLDVQRFDAIVAPLDLGPTTRAVYEMMPAPQGSTFLAVVAELKVDWPEEGFALLEFSRQDAVLRDGDARIQWVATHPSWCQTFRDGRQMFTRDSKRVAFSAVYAVPKDRASFKLALGGQEVDVAVPKSVTAMDASPAFAAKVTKVATLREVKGAGGASALAPAADPGEKLLAVTVQWQTKAAAGLTPPCRPDSFHHKWVNVRSGKRSFATIGELDSDGKLTGHNPANNGNSMQTGGSGGKPMKGQTTFVFAVPKDVRDFELTILGAAMDKGVSR